MEGERHEPGGESPDSEVEASEEESGVKRRKRTDGEQSEPGALKNKDLSGSRQLRQLPALV
jgi:hypothetical protein